MKTMLLGVAVVLTALAAQPALARNHHADRGHEYRDRHYEGNRGHYRDQGYDYDRYDPPRHDDGYYGNHESRRDRHHDRSYYYYDRSSYYYDRHSRRPERRHHPRSHH